MKSKTIVYTIIAFIISCSVFFVTYSKNINPVSLYRVYLSGETIGYINSKDELELYIDKKEQEIKDKYKVDKVYLPKELKIVKQNTYNKKVSSVENIYGKIKNISPFTIEGYVATINGIEVEGEKEKYVTENIYINVLNKDIFTTALKETLKVFVDENDYEKYINDTQEEILDTGSITENMYIENEITLKKSKLSVNDLIFTDTQSLSKYLLFGTLEEQKKYVVKEGDTIEEVSYNNKLSVEEFLIANESFTSADNLLYPGETVTLGILKPAFNLIEEEHVVELETSKFKTEIVYDNTLLVGVERVKQNGKNGTNKVTKKVRKSNGEVVSAVVIQSEELVPTVNKVIVRGKGNISVGSLGTWAWPTKIPYVITSNYGWRWGDFHDGLDISGTGYGSPIYAANDGVVVIASYSSINGNYIVINHNNGYYTDYAHMSSLMVKTGDIVSIGQQIGKMGSTGYSTGPHLHFGVWKGYPWRSPSINPLRLY